MVRKISQSNYKYCFEVYSSTADGIKACKFENGQLVKGHHGTYIIACNNAEELDSWTEDIQSNVAFNPLYELIKKRKEDQVRLS